MLTVLFCLFFQTIQEPGCFRGLFLHTVRADRTPVTEFRNGKRTGSDRRCPFTCDSDRFRSQGIIGDPDGLPCHGDTDIILLPIKGQASGFIDLPRFVMQESFGYYAAVKELEGPAVAVPFLSRRNASFRNRGSKALLIPTHAVMPFVVVLFFQPGLPVVVQLIYRLYVLELYFFQKAVHCRVEPLHQTLVM